MIRTLIIGAGLAGLYTAWRLRKAGQHTLIVEARSRIGGRIKGIAGERLDGNAPGYGAIDLGPSWFWPHQQRVPRLLQSLNLTAFEQRSVGAALFEQVVDQPPVRQLGAGAPPSLRICGGTTALTTALAETLDEAQLRLGHRVSSVARSNGQWRVSVQADSGIDTLHAQQLVLAVPPRQAARFLDDSLDGGLIQHLNRQQTWMAAQAKFVAVYDRPFWRDAGLAGQAFSRVGPMVELHDATPDGVHWGALFGFVGVSARRRLEESAERLQALCLAQLSRLFGQGAATPRHCSLQDWAREPFTATETDLDEPSAHAHFAWERFAVPLAAQNLWLAGSEFAEGEPGYLEGALEASERVVAALLAKDDG